MVSTGHRVRRDRAVLHVFIGFVFGVSFVCALGAVQSGDGAGQYQCCAAGDDSLAVFVTDTETGQTWRLSRTDTYDFGTPYQRKSVRSSQTPVVK